MTAAAEDFSSRSSASTRLVAANQALDVDRAIEPDVVRVLRPPGVAITPTVTMAAMAATARPRARRSACGGSCAIDDHV